MIEEVPIVPGAHTDVGDRRNRLIETDARQTRPVILNVACGSRDIAANAWSRRLHIYRGVSARAKNVRAGT